MPISPQNQFLMGMGSGLLSQPYTPHPQGNFAGLGQGLQSGMDAYNNAMILAQAQAEAAAKKKEFEEQAKARAAQQQGMEDYINNLDASDEVKAALRLQAGLDPQELAKTAVDRAMPKQESIKPDMGDSATDTAVFEFLSAGGTMAQLQQPEVQAKVIGRAEQIRAANKPQQTPGFALDFDPESKSFSLRQGVGVEGTSVGGMGMNEAQEEAATMTESMNFQDVVGEIIFDPAFEGSVGPGSLVNRATGKDYLTDSPEYQIRQRLEQQIEPRVLALGALVLKGSQTEGEWKRVRDTMPTADDSAAVWRRWYKDFIDIETKIRFGDQPEARDQARRNAGLRLATQPMTPEEAEKWLQPGDIYTGPDGKRYRIEQ